MVLGCGQGTWVGQLQGSTSAREGMTSSDFDDGCSLDVRRTPVLLHTFQIAAAVPQEDMTFKNTLFDGSHADPVTVAQGAYTAVLYTGVELSMAPGIATEFAEGIDLDFAHTFDSSNGSMGLYGTLTCGDQSAEIDWVFNRTMSFFCPSKIQIEEDLSTTSIVHIDPAQLFRQSSRIGGSERLLGQAIINADSNEDGYVNLYELDAIFMSELEGYDDYIYEPRLETLYDVIDANNAHIWMIDGAPCEKR